MNQLSDRFLTIFKELEGKLVSISNLKGGYIGYSRALDECHKRKNPPILGDNDIYNFLRSASDLRNILSHENDVCLPTEKFVDRFAELAEEIIHPLTVMDICTKKENLIIARPDSKLISIVDRMVDKHLSHVPVIDKGAVVGVFSQSTFYQYFQSNRSLKVDSESTISDFVKETDYLAHIDEIFIFVPKHLRAYNLMKYLYKKNPKDKKVSAIFVTENGKPFEFLLGMITQTDILKAKLD